MDQKQLLDFIDDVESRHFRTQYDTGANINAMIVWNMLRKFAGLDELTRDDLRQRYADEKGWTLEQMREDERRMNEYLQQQRRRDW